MFESFLANKFAAAKRFGLEGCETLIPGMKALIDRSTDLGVDSIVMGMPHRGVCARFHKHILLACNTLDAILNMKTCWSAGTVSAPSKDCLSAHK